MPSVEHSHTSIDIWIRVRRKLAVVFAVIGAGYTASFLFPWLLNAVFPSLGDDTSVIKVAYSPNRQYKAILYNQNGGGAISPYCFDFISVVPASVADKAANKTSYRIYAGSCHSLGGPPVILNAPLLNWPSDTSLDVTFNLEGAAIGINEFKLRGWDASGHIHIVPRQFVEQNKP